MAKKIKKDNKKKKIVSKTDLKKIKREKNIKNKEKLRKNLEGIVEHHPNTKTMDQIAKVVDVVDEKDSSSIIEKVSKYSKRKILITTSRKVTKKTVRLARDIENVIPNSTYTRRSKKHKMERVISDANEKYYTHVVLVGENNRVIDRLTVICLPDGPTLYFKIVKHTLSKNICKGKQNTAHFPEVTSTNFKTNLGKATASVFESLFEKPEIEGRQMVSLHVNRDFLFLRRYIYDMHEKIRGVNLKEIGPRVSLKLLGLQNEAFRRDLEYTWNQKKHKKEKKTFYL